MPIDYNWTLQMIKIHKILLVLWNFLAYWPKNRTVRRPFNKMTLLIIGVTQSTLRSKFSWMSNSTIIISSELYLLFSLPFLVDIVGIHPKRLYCSHLELFNQKMFTFFCCYHLSLNLVVFFLRHQTPIVRTK